MKRTEGETYPWLHSLQRDVFDVCVQFHMGYLEAEMNAGPYAQEISRALTERYRELYDDENLEPLNNGRLYPALDGLVERGLLRRIDDAPGRRVPYQVTNEGLRYAIRLQRAFIHTS